MFDKLSQAWHRRTEQIAELATFAAAARAQTGKSALTQAREILKLRGAGGRCGVSDYYWYRLYDPGFQQGRGAPDFLGWRLQTEFCAALNPRAAVLPAWDKITFYTLAYAAGLPVAPVAATFSAAPRLSPVLGLHLASVEQAAHYLRAQASYPLFAKPSHSQQGVGAASIDSYDGESDSLRLQGGASLAVTDFLRRLTHSVDPRYHRPECGMLFQPRLSSAREIVALTQWPAVSGVRVTCLNGPDGVTPLRAVWKVAVPPNHVDNFSKGKYGNMLADVDLQTGEVSRLLTGFGPHHLPMTRHPLTGADLCGFKLPGWTRVLDACRLAGPVFPLLRLHGWDFVLTDTGPFMLELNDTIATEMLQVHGRGLLTSVCRGFLQSNHHGGKPDWVARL